MRIPLVLTLVLLTAIAACKGTPEAPPPARPTLSPAEMCEIIFAGRMEIFTPEAVARSERHKAAFTDYCLTLPQDYLACESLDLGDFMGLTDAERAQCQALMDAHQEAMNRVIITGSPTP